jgi:hypothetical protein
MTNDNNVRRCGYLALGAGLAWSATSLLSLLFDDPTRLLDVLMVAPLTMTIAAFLALHRFQHDRLGRLGQWGYRLSLASFLLLFASQAVIIAGIERLYWVGFPVAAGIWFAGFLLYGIATARAGVLAPWIGIAIAVSEVAAALLGVAFSPISPIADHGDYSGALAHGLIWLAIGAALLRGHAFIANRGAQPVRPSAALAASRK